MPSSYDYDDSFGNSRRGTTHFPQSDAGTTYNAELEAVYRGGTVADPSFALWRDPYIWTKMRRHPDFEALIQMRRRAFARTSWSVEASGQEYGDKLVAALVEQAISKISDFGRARYNLAEAAFRGRSYAFIHGRLIEWSPTIPTPAGGTFKLPPRAWWVPTKLQHVDKSRVEQRKLDGKLVWHFYSIARRKWEPIEHPELLVVHSYEETEASLNHGRGLLDALWYPWHVMLRLEREGLQGVARWAQGVVVAKIDGLREGSKTNAEVASGVLAMLEKTLSKHYQVWDKNDDVTNLPGPGEGHAMVREFRDVFFQSALRLVMGAVLPFGGASDVGSLARSQEESEKSAEYLQFDYDLMGEDLTSTLVATIVKINRANVAGVLAGEYELPQLKLAPKIKHDPEKMARVIGEAINTIGARFSRADVHERLGIPEAKEGEPAYGPESSTLLRREQQAQDAQQQLEDPSVEDAEQPI